MHEGEEGHARPGWTTSRRGQDSPWKSQSEGQRTGINGESTSMVWPTLGSRTAKEQEQDCRILLTLVQNHIHINEAVAIVTTLQPVKHRSWQNGRGQVMLKITLTVTLTLTYTRPPMFDRLQHRNNSHSVYIKALQYRSVAVGWK